MPESIGARHEKWDGFEESLNCVLDVKCKCTWIVKVCQMCAIH